MRRPADTPERGEPPDKTAGRPYTAAELATRFPRRRIVLLGVDALGAKLIARASAGMLVAMATVSAFTGARTSVVPMKRCPFIKSAVAIAHVVGTSLG